MIMRIFLLIVAALVSLGFVADASQVELKGEMLAVSGDTGDGHAIVMEFSRCMANELYTFSRVTVDGAVVNRATSDNIGPFLIKNSGWTGGNHLMPDGVTHSAHTLSVTIAADGKILECDTVMTARSVVVTVVNRLLCPFDASSTFAIETMRYTVQGNSIQVDAEHQFQNPEPLVVERYYGMQSMMTDENAVLTPEGEYSQWTPVAKVDRFAKSAAKGFDTFIERSDKCYQAAYMCPEVGLGDRHAVKPDDVVFIGNSWSKCYHKLMGDVAVKKGDTARWKGVYSWFVVPVTDNECEFAYRGYIDGKHTLFRKQLGTAGDARMKNLRVMTYNLRFSQLASAERLAKRISEENPDFVALQEVDINTSRFTVPDSVRLQNTIAIMAEKCGMFGFFGRTIDFAGGYYGIGILSKYPCVSMLTHNLPNPAGTEPRVLLEGTFLLPGGTMKFSCTHLDHKSDSARAVQARFVLEKVATGTMPSVVAGDFNARPGSNAIELMEKSMVNLTCGNPTFPATAPVAKIDYIFGYPASKLRLLSTEVLDTLLSDHRPVVSTLLLTF